MANPKPVYRTKAQIREAFNAQGFTEKVRLGQASYRPEGKASPAPAHLGFPEGTVSERIAIVGGNGKKLAVAHRYRLANGGIAGTGYNDPKQLLMGDELWLVDPNDKSP